jgi:hypothetical protein
VIVSVKLATLVIGIAWRRIHHSFNAALMLGVNLAFNYSNLIVALNHLALIKNTNISINNI